MSFYERMERVIWQNHNKAIKDEFSTLKQEIIHLHEHFVNAIDKAVLEVKDLDDYNPVAEKFDPLHGASAFYAKQKSINNINKTWRNLQIKIGRRLQVISDEIQQPFQCFICPSKDRLCEDCKVRKGQNET